MGNGPLEEACIGTSITVCIGLIATHLFPSRIFALKDTNSASAVEFSARFRGHDTGESLDAVCAAWFLDGCNSLPVYSQHTATLA